jgi:hypothetical protein
MQQLTSEEALKTPKSNILITAPTFSFEVEAFLLSKSHERR